MNIYSLAVHEHCCRAIYILAMYYTTARGEATMHLEMAFIFNTRIGFVLHRAVGPCIIIRRWGAVGLEVESRHSEMVGFSVGAFIG